MPKIRTLGTIVDPRRDGNVQWKIPPETPQLWGMLSDCYFKSPPFHFLNRSWYLRFYPNGVKNNEFAIAVYLVAKSFTHPENSLTLNISLKFSFDNIWNIKDQRITATHIFNNNDRSYAWVKILETNTVWTNEVNVSNITIFCFATEDVLPDFACLRMRKKTQVSDDLYNLFLEERLTDVTFQVQRREIKAHKLILGIRSSEFNSLFESDVNKDYFLIENCDHNAFKMLLHFLYTGTTDNISKENFKSLYEVAAKYYCLDLTRICAEFMKNNISEDICVEILDLAHKYADKVLLDACVNFAKKICNQSFHRAMDNVDGRTSVSASTS